MKINVKRDKNNYIVLDRVITKNKILHVYTVEIDYLICITNIRCMIICIKFLIQLHDLLYDLLYIFSYLYVFQRIQRNEIHNEKSHCGEEPSTNNVTKRGTACLRT